MQTFKLSTIFLAFIFLAACANEQSFVIKERTAPPEISEVDETVFFDFDSDVIADSEMLKIENLLPAIAEQKSLLIEIHGHADEVGDNMYNVELAKKRAEAVKQVFESLSADLPTIKLFSWGEEIPKDESESEQARTRNRRVEIVILP